MTDLLEFFERRPSDLLAVLLVTDLFHPIDYFPVLLFLNRNVRHGSGRGGTMPVLFAGRDPNDVSRPYLLDRPAVTLRSAASSRDDKSLAKRMRMPRSPRTRLKGHAGALNERGIGRLNQRIDSYRAREPV